MPHNFAKSSPYSWLQYTQSKLRWRFRKILWPSQNIWTLPKVVFCSVLRFESLFPVIGNSGKEVILSYDSSCWDRWKCLYLSNHRKRRSFWKFYTTYIGILLQVNLFQKLFFLQNIGRTCYVQKLFWPFTVWINCFIYSRVRNKHTGTLIIFWGFFQGLCPY